MTENSEKPHWSKCSKGERGQIDQLSIKAKAAKITIKSKVAKNGPRIQNGPTGQNGKMCQADQNGKDSQKYQKLKKGRVSRTA